MTLIEKLHTALAQKAPIHGVSLGRKNDKATWRIDFKDEATEAQRVAAATVLAAFDLDAAIAEEEAEIPTEPLDRRALLAEIDAALTIAALKAVLRTVVRYM